MGRPLLPTTWPPSPSTTEPTEATAFPWRDTCGSATPRPNPRLSHGWDTVTALVVCTEDTASATLLPRLLLPPLSPFASMVLLPLDTVCAGVTLMLRPSQRLMRGTDTVVFTATVLALAMEGMAMVDSTAMERGPLMLRLSHGWDMVDSMAVGPMVSPPSWLPPTAP